MPLMCTCNLWTQYRCCSSLFDKDEKCAFAIFTSFMRRWLQRARFEMEQLVAGGIRFVAGPLACGAGMGGRTPARCVYLAILNMINCGLVEADMVPLPASSDSKLAANCSIFYYTYNKWATLLIWHTKIIPCCTHQTEAWEWNAQEYTSGCNTYWQSITALGGGYNGFRQEVAIPLAVGRCRGP